MSQPWPRDSNETASDQPGAVQGGKWTKFGFFTPKALKDRSYLRDEITVDGQPADSQERLQVVCDHLDLVLAFDALELAWLDANGLPSASQFRIRVAAIKEHVAGLGSALDCAEACLRVARNLGAAKTAIPEPNWLDGQADEWLELIDASALQERHLLAAERATECLRHLEAAQQLHDAHPVVVSLIEAVERRDVTAYSERHQRVREIEQARRDQEVCQLIESTLAPAVPGLIDAVLRSIDDKQWDDRFGDWEDAWRWAVADNWLGKRADFAYGEQLLQRRQDIDEAVRRSLAESRAPLRAWTHFFSRLSHAESAALRSWREAVGSMGRGTGRSSRMERLRREARQYMDQCRDAIPVWIMPRYLVAEMVDPVLGRYDLVIVDEASQLGIKSLFLFYISKS